MIFQKNIEMLESIIALLVPARQRLFPAQGKILRDCQPIGFGDHGLSLLRRNGFRLAVKRIPVAYYEERYFKVSNKF
jgi:hypothetical protein